MLDWLFRRRKPEPPKAYRPPITVDLSDRVWGHNYEQLERSPDGHKIRVALWYTPPFGQRDLDVGDYLLLKGSNADGRTRYRIDTLKQCYDPRDMAFADLTFAPRELAIDDKGQIVDA